MNGCKKKIAKRLGICVVGSVVGLAPLAAEACTRVVYLGNNEIVLTARSMDWESEIGTNLYILPRGMKRTGKTGDNSFLWTSKFGSVVATGYDISTTDGVNEAGLSASVLWLKEAEYPSFGPDSKPGLTIAAWAQYVLDSFATVSDAVETLSQQPFTIVTAEVPGQDRITKLHLSLSDPTGDSAIIEYIGGEQVIYHGRQYQVMTNSPAYDAQLALNNYWEEIGGTVMLPGTSRPADRFARASFYVNAIPQDTDPDTALASVLSLIRSVSVPFGISTTERPEISTTRWRSIVDHKRKLYFFESALSLSTFWVDLGKIDFSAETGMVKNLDLGPNQSRTLVGDATEAFVASKPFTFLGLKSLP